jgi:hypothetical protein
MSVPFVAPSKDTGFLWPFRAFQHAVARHGESSTFGFRVNGPLLLVAFHFAFRTSHFALNAVRV